MARNEAGAGRTLRWIVSAAVLVVIVSVLAAVAVPLAVSASAVRDRLERDISDWTGQTVAIGAKPKLTFWPVPSITLRGVSITSRDLPDAAPLVAADSVTADFSVLSALAGKPNFTNFRFTRPVFTFERFENGAVNWSSGNGRLADAVAVAKANASTSAEKAGSEEAVAADVLATISVADARIRLVDHKSGTSETVTSIDGSMKWGRLDSSGSLDLNGVFRGEKIRLAASSDKPLLLLARASAPLTAQFDSAPLSFTLSGTANFSAMPFLGGKLSLKTPSVRKTLEWARTDIKPGEAIGALSIDADLSTQNDRINLDNLIVEIDGNRGIGVLDVQMPDDEIPVIAGTLAFNKLDITSFLRAFTPLPKPGNAIADTIDTRFLRQLGLDLRLSAQSANLGPLALSNLAAAARIEQGRAVFDVGEAAAYGGTVVGKVQISEAGLDGGGEVQLSAKQMDFGRIFDALKLTGPLPRGSGNLDMMLKSTRPLWATDSRDIDGHLKLSMRGGTIPSFDISAFRTLSKKERFFDLGKVSSGSLPFSSARFEAKFSDGLAEIKHGAITTETSVVDLDGVVPYTQGSLALAGRLAPKPPAEGEAAVVNAPAPIRFFIGGSWPTPVISPVFTP